MSHENYKYLNALKKTVSLAGFIVRIRPTNSWLSLMRGRSYCATQVVGSNHSVVQVWTFERQNDCFILFQAIFCYYFQLRVERVLSPGPWSTSRQALTLLFLFSWCLGYRFHTHEVSFCGWDQLEILNLKTSGEFSMSRRTLTVNCARNIFCSNFLSF